MEVKLLKAFQFQLSERLPYRFDGRGGHVFHGAGSHIQWSDLRDRWYQFAFEVATIDQPEEAVLQETRLRVELDGQTTEPRQSVVAWEPKYRQRTSRERYSCYRWEQWLQIDLTEPSLATIDLLMTFSDRPEPWVIEGATRVLVDLHPDEPPPRYRAPIWHLRKLLGWYDV